MGYLINAWNAEQNEFKMSMKQVVSLAGDGSLENEESIEELREFFSLLDLKTMGRLLKDCLSKEKKQVFDSRGFALQDLINEMGRRLGYKVENGLYRGKKNEVGQDGLWILNDEHYIIMESKTSDDYSIEIEKLIGYRDKLKAEGRIPSSNKKTSILIVYGSDRKSAFKNAVKGSDYSSIIRLISADALFRLVELSEQNDVSVMKQIHSLLRPEDYHVLDNLIELVFPQTKEERIITTPSKKEEVCGEASNKVNTTCPDNPLFADKSLKIGPFVYKTMENLSKSGYVFSDEDIKALCSDQAMNKIIGMQRNMPLFRIYDPKNKRGHYIGKYARYYAKPLSFGKYNVLLCSQLYENDRAPFKNWINSLSK